MTVSGCLLFLSAQSEYLFTAGQPVGWEDKEYVGGVTTCMGIRETPLRRPTSLEEWERNGSRKERGREKDEGESEREEEEASRGEEEEEKEEKKEEEEDREQVLQELSRH